MDDVTAAETRQRLQEVEERIDRIGRRLAAGYGKDSDRDGWLLWLRELEQQRADLRAALDPGSQT